RKPAGSSVLPPPVPPHAGDEPVEETGSMPTGQRVSTHPPQKRMPINNNDPVGNRRLSDNIQPASVSESTVPTNSLKAEGIKRDLATLLAVDQPLEQSFRKIKEMKYIDATVTVLQNIKEQMSEKWNLPNDQLIEEFKTVHKAAIKQLKNNNSDDVKVTFNLPDGKRVRLIPPELDDLDLSDLESWMQQSLALVNEMKQEKQSVLPSALTTRTNGAQQFNALLSQLAQLGASRQEIQGFQARYDAIQHPVISLSFYSRNQKSAKRAQSVTPGSLEPRPAIEIANDHEKKSVGSEDSDSAFGKVSAMEDDHQKRVKKARKAYEDLMDAAHYHEEENKGTEEGPSQETLNAKAKLMAELEQRLSGKSDHPSGLSSTRGKVAPSEDNTTPETPGDDASRGGSQPPPPGNPGQ
ncbi:hypothetical protein, partial [Endozoicomonas sp. ONNA2]|uniref:hypothetical protein n=1 Tax=Endozoicomonas sp. ONNA2 TaxID=2828741 RepID=UPI0021487574